MEKISALCFVVNTFIMQFLTQSTLTLPIKMTIKTTTYLVLSFILRALMLSTCLLIYQSLYSPHFHPKQPVAINVTTTIADYNDSSLQLSMQRATQLAAAIRFQTISGDDLNDEQSYSLKSDKEFRVFREWLRTQFPLVHQYLKHETVGRNALLFSWHSANQQISNGDNSSSDTGSDNDCNSSNGGDNGNKGRLINVMLCAHMDVVPAPIDQQRWSAGVGPFEGRIKDGYIWGRGTLDFKNGVVGVLRAVEELLGAGHIDRPPAGVDVYLAFGDDEEVGGKNGAYRISKLLSQRGIRLDLVLDEGTPLAMGLMPGLGEKDGDDDGPDSKKRFVLAMLGVAEKGMLTLQLTGNQTGGHSSMPPPAGTIISRLAEALTVLKSNPPPDPHLSRSPMLQTLAHLAPHMSESPLRRVLFSQLPNLLGIGSMFPSWLIGRLANNLYPLNSFLTTTQSPTMINGGIRPNVLPNQIKCTINYRIMPGTLIETVKSHVQAVLDRHGFNDISVSLLDSVPQAEASPITPVSHPSYQFVGGLVRGWFSHYLPYIVQSNSTIYADDLRLVVVPSLMVGGTDTKHYVPIADAIIRFSPVLMRPGDPERLHNRDERIGVDAYSAYIDFFKHLLRSLGELKRNK